MRILIAEDNPTQAEQLTFILERAGYEVAAAENGVRALEMLDERMPDLVISDIMMPLMDGRELCRRIKADPATREIPVILLTALSDAAAVLDGLECGADSFMTKPYSREYLLEHVARFLAGNKQPPGERISIKLDLPQPHKTGPLTINPQRMLTLLLSSYEAAFQRGLELSSTQDELAALNNELEQVVEERTAKLTTEIAASRELESLLKAGEARFRGVIENNLDGIIVLDNNGVIQYSNTAAQGLFCRSGEELRGNPFGFAVVDGEASEIELLRMDGKLASVEMRSVATDWYGSKVMVLLRDITQRKQYEEALRKTAEEMRKINEMKTNFIAIASHELRTPLTTIKGAVDVLVKGKAGPTNDVQTRFLRMVETSVNRLSALINDLLDVSRIESGKIELQRGEVDMSAVIGRVTTLLKPLADDKSIALRSVVPVDLPHVFADERKAEQVLINLVGNALKFTPHSGSVVIDVHPAPADHEGRDDEKKCLEIAVADTGVGISDKQKEHVFEKFFQAESSLVREQAGTGLGLVITKGIVEAHGGRIRFESAAGLGSTFFFTLPVFDERKNALHLLEGELVLAEKNHAPLSVVVLSPADPGGGGDGSETPRGDYLVRTLRDKVAAGLFRSEDRVFVVPLDNTAALILPAMDRSAAETALPRIRQALLDGAEARGKGFPLVIAAVVTYPEDGTTAEELLARAQQAAGGR